MPPPPARRGQPPGVSVAVLRSCGVVLAAALSLAAPSSAQPRPGVLRLEPYVYKAAGREIAAELGHLTVPERHERPQGKQIELAFGARLAAPYRIRTALVETTSAPWVSRTT
jgi:hypothetical protein